eukprot:c21379_g1_i1 orf=204-533(-)
MNHTSSLFTKPVLYYNVSCSQDQPFNRQVKRIQQYQRTDLINPEWNYCLKNKSRLHMKFSYTLSHTPPSSAKPLRQDKPSKSEEPMINKQSDRSLQIPKVLKAFGRTPS